MVRVLFCLQTMVCGGVEKELITILKRFDRNKYKLSLLLMYDSGDKILSQLPSDVDLINLTVDKKYYFPNFLYYLSSRFLCGDFRSMIYGFFQRLFRRRPVPLFVDLIDLPAIEREYDVAVCYHIHSPICLRYVIERIKAKRYLSWIHNDFSTTKFQIQHYEPWLKRYDKFACVSKQLKDEFLDIFPDFQDKTIVAHNIVDRDEIRYKMNETSDEITALLNEPRFKILTVGRFVEQKGFDIAIRACDILVKKGYDIKWYAIGYGKDLSLLQSLIDKYGLENNFIILGRRDNPYPFMKCVDLYVQPSRHEGFGITIEEVKVIGTYIVATDFAGAREQLQDNGTGMVVDSFKPDIIADSIITFINNPVTISRCVSNSDLEWKVIEDLFI